LAIPLAAVTTSLFGLVFGIPSLRLKGLYLAIATLSAHFITAYVLIHWESMTKGGIGLNVPTATSFGFPVDSDAPIFVLLLATVPPARPYLLPISRARPLCRPLLPQSLPHPGRPRLHRHSLSGCGGGGDGREPLQVQAPRFRGQLLLCRRRGRADGPPFEDPLPRRLHAAGGHRLPGHDHHRRHGQHPGIDLRGDLQALAARAPEAGRAPPPQRLPARFRLHRLPARHRVRPRGHPVPHVRAAGARSHLATIPQLLDALAVRVLT